MITFFLNGHISIYAVSSTEELSYEDREKLIWLFKGAKPISKDCLKGNFLGHQKEMISPFSTNAVEITQIMGISNIDRIEEFHPVNNGEIQYDRMIQKIYNQLDQNFFFSLCQPSPIQKISNIEKYNLLEGLALNSEEIIYLKEISNRLGRALTDSEVFGFSQVNSEHCRHKIFNSTFVIDGIEQEDTLFQLIKKTSIKNPNFIVSAYEDNVAFISGPTIEQFSCLRKDCPDFFTTSEIESVISLKAETHNFPTTVEPFNGAATGSGGEIRDRLAGGRGSLPLAGTAVYFTSYTRLAGGRQWENKTVARPWLYRSPSEILIKASQGANDFGNKFGQPLICGSILTFEHFENGKKYGFDKVVMLAGGVGYTTKEYCKKNPLKLGDQIILLGGDNYRIGLGGSSVSSVDTGVFDNTIELKAVQRSNPEMQKRVMNTIRALVESENNPIVSIHDHGAGGHLNCFSELLKDTGGVIEISKLPLGDYSLSQKEILSNESQERIGLVAKSEDIEIIRKIALRERTPFYIVGRVSDDKKLIVKNSKDGSIPFELDVNQLFDFSPKLTLDDRTTVNTFADISYDCAKVVNYIEQVLQLEAVACKDWLTNKVDRSVTGKVATQQTCGSIQLPLNNLGVVALDFATHKGVATSIGHAPVATLIDTVAGGRLAISEALLNLIWAPLTHGLKGISLSANWMWPAKNPGENARLYQAVKAVSNFACNLGINIPTGKDSLSMTQKYPDGDIVYSPGTVIISAVAEVEDVRKTISPKLEPIYESLLVYVDFSSAGLNLGGSSLGQILNALGNDTPSVNDEKYFINTYNTIQSLIANREIIAGHDISAGGLITSMLEMCFSEPKVGLDINLSDWEDDIIKILFSENPAVLLQIDKNSETLVALKKKEAKFKVLGKIKNSREINIKTKSKESLVLNINHLRDYWYKTSFELDTLQCNSGYAEKRKENIFNQTLEYKFPNRFDGKLSTYGINNNGLKTKNLNAAIIREKGVNGDREMAYSLHLAGFNVKDVHITDLISGREDLVGIHFIVFVGGFSNSDVLGSAKGWAGAFLFNTKAKIALERFYNRTDTLSLGVCNGCQLMMELGLIERNIEMENHPKLNTNGSGKFESAFLNINIPDNNSVMFNSLSGTRLGVWVAHKEGKFELEEGKKYNVAAYYSFENYPGNPNDSPNSVAGLFSDDGRHMALMPHIERSLFPWNWPYYNRSKIEDEISPWIEAFANARDWVKKNVPN